MDKERLLADLQEIAAGRSGSCVLEDYIDDKLNTTALVINLIAVLLKERTITPEQAAELLTP